MYFENATVAILASGEQYVDALTSISLSKKYEAPILLTQKNNMPRETKEVINHVAMKHIIVVGGNHTVEAHQLHQ